MAGHDARAIANHILDMAKEQGRDITVMQLLKLDLHRQWLVLGPARQTTRPGSGGGLAIRAGLSVRLSRFQQVRVSADHREERYARRRSAIQLPLMDDERELLRGVTVHYGKLHAFRLSRHDP